MATGIQFTVPLPPTIVEPEVTYVAETVPAKVVYVSGTTLFHVSLMELGNALRWGTLAQLNNLVDPWITGLTKVLVPPVVPTSRPTGLYAPLGALASDALAPPSSGH